VGLTDLSTADVTECKNVFLSYSLLRRICMFVIESHAVKLTFADTNTMLNNNDVAIWSIRAYRLLGEL
jgi:hypothetical protein